MENQKFCVAFQLQKSAEQTRVVCDPRTAMNLAASLMVCDDVLSVTIMRV